MYQQAKVKVEGLWLVVIVILIPERDPSVEEVILGVLVPEKSPLGGLHGMEVVESVDRHVVLSDKGGDFKVVPAHDLVQVLHTRQAVHLVLDRGRHERREPPSHHLGPECGMYDVARLQILLILVRQYIINLLQPLEGGIVGR